jgi:hypothetical protein
MNFGCFETGYFGFGCAGAGQIGFFWISLLAVLTLADLEGSHFCIFIGFVYNFIDFVVKFTVEIIEHIVASYKTSDFT